MSNVSSARDGGKDKADFDGLDASAGVGPHPRKGGGEGFDMGAWWEERSLPQKILAGIAFGILGIGFLALFGLVVMLLWNWLMPEIFGLKRLDYWQAWGLLILCWILFKNWGSGDSSSRSERKRKRQLRRYIRESENPAGEDTAASQEV